MKMREENRNVLASRIEDSVVFLTFFFHDLKEAEYS